MPHPKKTESGVATCIGCGCDDYHACYDEKAGHACSWLRVDYKVGCGVCSCCEDSVKAWDAGSREMRPKSRISTAFKHQGRVISIVTETIEDLRDVWEELGLPELDESRVQKVVLVSPDNMPSLDDRNLATRAIQIADESMLALIECQTNRSGGPDGQLLGLVDESGGEVSILADADPAIIEAFEWLSQRGLAELVSDPQGECVLLTKKSLNPNPI